MVECHLAKVDVEGSNPFSRSRNRADVPKKEPVEQRCPAGFFRLSTAHAPECRGARPKGAEHRRTRDSADVTVIRRTREKAGELQRDSQADAEQNRSAVHRYVPRSGAVAREFRHEPPALPHPGLDAEHAA